MGAGIRHGHRTVFAKREVSSATKDSPRAVKKAKSKSEVLVNGVMGHLIVSTYTKHGFGERGTFSEPRTATSLK